MLRDDQPDESDIRDELLQKLTNGDDEVEECRRHEVRRKHAVLTRSQWRFTSRLLQNKQMNSCKTASETQNSSGF
jgi:hypothetical protein